MEYWDADPCPSTGQNKVQSKICCFTGHVVLMILFLKNCLTFENRLGAIHHRRPVKRGGV